MYCGAGAGGGGGGGGRGGGGVIQNVTCVVHVARIISTNMVTSAICWSGGKMVAFKLSNSYVISSIYGLCGIA